MSADLGALRPSSSASPPPPLIRLGAVSPANPALFVSLSLIIVNWSLNVSDRFFQSYTFATAVFVDENYSRVLLSFNKCLFSYQAAGESRSTLMLSAVFFACARS